MHGIAATPEHDARALARRAQVLAPVSPATRPRRSDLLHRIPPPGDLQALTDIDTAREVHPGEAGLGGQQAARIWRAVEALYRTRCYPSILFCLRRRGHIVFNRAIGHVRGNGPDDPPQAIPVPARVSTPGCLFSASKALTAMLVHRLEESGELNLLNPISHYIPEFARRGKERITIYHLLSHRAGIPGVEQVGDPTVVLDHRRCLELVCDAAPLHLFGRRQAYHAVTGGIVLAEIVRRVSGLDVRTAWRRWFKEPMGLKTLDYGANARVRSAMTEQKLSGIQGCALVDGIVRRMLGATLAEVKQLLDDPRFYQVAIPAANMVGTAEEASAFYQMLLDGGMWNGRRILRRETILRATMEAGPHVFDATIGLPLRFSQGFMLGGAPVGLFGQFSHHAFGHMGLVNNLTWADPERGISVALLVSGIPLLAPNLPALLRLIATIAAQCPRDTGESR